MAIDLGNGKHVLSISLIDIKNGNEMNLFERHGSKCHFNEDIFFGEYIITLRIDWGDIQNTDPVLDADIYRNDSGKKGIKIKSGKKNWHHTNKTFDASMNMKYYSFSFKELQLNVIAKINFALSLSMDAILIKESDNVKNT